MAARILSNETCFLCHVHCRSADKHTESERHWRQQKTKPAHSHKAACSARRWVNLFRVHYCSAFHLGKKFNMKRKRFHSHNLWPLISLCHIKTQQNTDPMWKMPFCRGRIDNGVSVWSLAAHRLVWMHSTQSLQITKCIWVCVCVHMSIFTVCFQ